MKHYFVPGRYFILCKYMDTIPHLFNDASSMWNDFIYKTEIFSIHKSC